MAHSSGDAGHHAARIVELELSIRNGEIRTGLFIRILAGWPVTVLLVIFLVMMGLIMGIGPLGNVVLMGGWHARESHESKVWDAFTWARGEARDYMSDGGFVKEDGKKMKPLLQELGRYRYACLMHVLVLGLSVS